LSVLGVRRRAGTLSALVSSTNVRDDAAAAAFDALRLPAAGLQRDGTIVIANQAFARFLGADNVAAIEGKNIHRTMISKLDPELYDDLRLVALNGKVIRRHLTLQRDEKVTNLRFLLSPTSGACGHCMLILHSA
jgi:PAS domain-containing protein